jgi:hypothetical protein
MVKGTGGENAGYWVVARRRDQASTLLKAKFKGLNI